MPNILRELSKQIRTYMVRRIAENVALKFRDETYIAKVEKLAVYKYKSWEIAMAEAMVAYENRETDPQAYLLKQSAALDARAQFIDTMREYWGCDLLSIDQERPDFPVRPATYDIRKAQTRNAAGETVTQDYLVKVTSDKIPALNYPQPLFTGHSLREFKKQIKAIARNVNEAKAAAEMQKHHEQRAAYYSDGNGGRIKLSKADVDGITQGLIDDVTPN